MVFPLYHVLADVAEWKEGTIVECSSNRPLTAAALAVESAGSLHLLTMNLTGAYQRVVISPLGAEQVWMRNLDTSTAYEAMFEPESFRQKKQERTLKQEVTLGDYQSVIGRSRHDLVTPALILDLDHDYPDRR